MNGGCRKHEMEKRGLVLILSRLLTELAIRHKRNLSREIGYHRACCACVARPGTGKRHGI